MKQNQLLINAYNFVAESPIFHQDSVFEWCQRLSKLYDCGGLYACYHHETLIALAGAFRIEEWNERWLNEVPSRPQGRKLYIAFFISQCSRNTDPLKMVRRFLGENPDIEEVFYCEKNRRLNPGTKLRLKHHRVARRPLEALNSGGRPFSRPRILPPDLISLPDFESIPSSILEPQSASCDGRF